jgi:hypothetical protein
MIADSWAESVGLPLTLLIGVDDEHMGEVGTKEFANKAVDYFTDFYGAHIEGDSNKDRIERNRLRDKMKETVIKQIKAVISGKTFGNGLDAIGVWMQKDILFPQILEAHLIPAKKIDLVELYLNIHKRRK